MKRLFEVARKRKLELGIFCSAYLIFALLSGPRFFHQSQAPHFIYQGEAWLQGQLQLAVDPPNQEDWAKVGDKFYVSFPPFPALLMLPLVAIFGYQFNDTSFTVFFGALNLLLFFLLLQKLSRAGDSPRTQKENLWLALFLGFGTVHFYMCIRGEVWFTAQTIGVSLLCLYLLLAHRAEHPFLAGLALACASLTRTPLAFAFVFFLFELVAPDGHFDPEIFHSRLAPTLKKGLSFAAPLTVFALAMMWINYARFGSPLEFGHSALWNNRVNAWVQNYGLFHPRYLEQNLQSAFLRLPILKLHPLSLTFDGHGMSIFLTTPLLVFLAWPRRKPRLHRALWVTCLVVALPAFFYQNDGYFQFGYRFSLDYLPILFLLLAIGSRPMRRAFYVLGGVGVVVGLIGALVFKGGWLG